MKLSSQEAQRLVDLVAQAQTREAAVEAAGTAFSFLVGQLHALADSANGYPRNPIEGRVWKEGCRLASICDQFADAAAHWNQRRGEEQATRLAASMAMQVVAHYPEEIFPRVLRNAKCCGALEMTTDAAEAYHCIAADFDALDLEEILELTEPLEEADVTILTCLREALSGLERLDQTGLTDAQRALAERVNEALSNRPRVSGSAARGTEPP